MLPDRWALKQVGEPASEPVTLALVKKRLAVDHSDDDDLILADIRAARRLAERNTGRVFGARAFRLSLPCPPKWGRVEFPVEPVVSVESVGYTDFEGVTGTVAADKYNVFLDGSPPLLQLVTGYTLPTLSADLPAPLVINFTAGDDTENDTVAAAIRLMVAYWYDNPDGRAVNSQGFRELPPGAAGLLNSLWTGGI